MTRLSKRIEPFRALLYNQERVGNLSEVVAPPYDLIDADRQDELYNRSPYNIVRLELGREADRYAASAATLAKWRADDILRVAPRPAIYLYTQLFESAAASSGAMVSSRACGWKISARGRILPHEKTFPAAKADRLKLLTRAQYQCQFDFRPLLGNACGTRRAYLECLRARAARRCRSMISESKISSARSRRPRKSRRCSTRWNPRSS